MAIQGVDTKCYILALFVRDDGERFLLGSGHYEFKDTQMHFAANAIQNDIVEVQGNDGFLLAGQVRRPGTQSFDGYVGDGTMSKEETESYRRQFFSFFRKNFFYKVIYVFSDGTAIQRKSGFLVDDPTVEELYQMYPEYHVALNFEDVNYYSYSEDEEGQEQYAKEATIDTSSMRATGGLVWDNLGVVWEDTQWGGEQTASGTEMTIRNEMYVPSIVDDIRLDGDTYQQTYSGYNLIDLVPMTNTQPTRYQQCAIETVMDSTLGRNVLHITGTNNYPSISYQLPQRLESGKYYVLKFTYRSTVSGSPQSETMWFAPNWLDTNYWDVLGSINNGRAKGGDGDTENSVGQSATWKTTSRRFYVVPSQHSSASSSYTHICFSLGYNANATKELWLADAEVYEITEDEWSAGTYTSKDYEPYTGGPAPNPDYPQAVQTVTGEQTIKTNGKNLLTGDYAAGTHLGVEHSWDNVFVKVYGTTTASYTDLVTNSIGSILPPGTYTFSISKPISQFRVNFRVQYGGSNHDAVIMPGDTYATLTIPDNVNNAIIQRPFISGMATGTFVSDTFGLMLEEGSTATPFQRYYTQSHTIDLGSTELCKIGNYQDYIYESGDDWYVHKEVIKISPNGTEKWKTTSTPPPTGQFYVYTSDFDSIVKTKWYSGLVSDNFTMWPGTPGWLTPTTTVNGAVFSNSDSSGADALRIMFPSSIVSSVETAKTWFATNLPVFYYPLAAPTDTKITDATLVGQLDALGAMKLFIGENNLAVQATGTNLPAPLSFKYYTTVAMTGAEWEEGGSGGATVVEVDSITNTYPIWRVKGPAVDPQLSVINTNTTIRYTGAVTSTQTLEIDMFNKTAKLNGVSVIGNVSGDWVSLAPGTNRVIYTAENADAQPSTIEWQEVVG